MQKILIIGEETKAQLLRTLLENDLWEIEISDGDEEEDFKEFDVIFDLNFDDDSENFPIYASLRDKLVFLSTVKQSISEAAYIYPSKVRSKIFGLNALENYLNSEWWEVSAYRQNEWPAAEDFLRTAKKNFFKVEDIVGLYRPRVDFLAINEKIRLLSENLVSDSSSFIKDSLKEIDEIGVTPIFETLMAIYEETKEIQFLPCSLLKKKYLRNHHFVRTKDV